MKALDDKTNRIKNSPNKKYKTHSGPLTAHQGASSATLDHSPSLSGLSGTDIEQAYPYEEYLIDNLEEFHRETDISLEKLLDTHFFLYDE